jgi:hypothetical protein
VTDQFSVPVRCAGILPGGKVCLAMVKPPKRLCKRRHVGQWADVPSAQPGPGDTLLLHIRATKIPIPAREWRFMSERQFRFDFAWPEKMIAAEIEGGTWVSGAHNRGGHFESDCIKYAEAILRGWSVFRFTTAMVESGVAVGYLERALRPKAKP